MYLIKETPLPESVKSFYSTEDSDDWLTNLSALNIFIGPNNSGKSRLLRSFFTYPFETITSTFPEVDYAATALTELAHSFNTSFADYEANYDGHRLASVKTLEDHVAIITSLTKRQLSSSHLAIAESSVRDIEQQCVTIRQRLHGGDDLSHKIRLLQDKCSETTTAICTLAPNLPEKIDFFYVYLPTLRGLRPMPGGRFEFIKRTAIDYFRENPRLAPYAEAQEHRGSLASHPIITGEEFYDEILRYLRGDLEQRDTILEYEQFLTKTFFDGRKVALIPRDESDVLFIKIGDEDEYPVYNLGDGLQHLLIMTMPIFLHRDKNLLLFIEEPELFLHPGYQRLLIDAFLDERLSKTRQIFVTTHSNHFLDITLDSKSIAIFDFYKRLPEGEDRKKKAKFHIRNTTNEDFSVLERLGIRNSSVLLSNCTIWVEGITDRYYLRHFLEIIMNAQKLAFEEDLHYSFVEYSGSNIAHWAILDHEDGVRMDRVCKRIFLIADMDVGKEKRHEQLKRALGDQCYVLQCREIENILTPQTIVSVIKSYEAESIECKPFGQTSYKKRKLGKFIEERVLVDKEKSSRRSKHGRPYSDTSGAIRGKVEFCKRALESVRSVDDLSEEAVSLANKLCRFIGKCNT